ncbi:6-bladed beta-propeller [Belliella baltica]|nr:6-bladed beta-propeller [Belliella baltica]
MKLITLFTLVFIISCSPKTPSINEGSISIDLDKSELGYISEIVTEIDYVLLGSESSSYLSEPKKIKFDQNQNIYVSDGLLYSLFVFHPSGELNYSLTPSGKGPREFLKISDYNLLDDSILILDNAIGKVLKFDLAGNFIEEFKFRDKSTHFFQKNDYLLKFTSYRSDYDGFNFLKYNLIDGSSSGIVPYPIEKESIGNFSFQYSFINPLRDNSVYYNIPYSYEVAEFDVDSGDLKDLLIFDFGKYSLNTSDYELLKEGRTGRDKFNSEVSEKKLIRYVATFLPFEKINYMSVVQGDNSSRHTILMDKKKNIIFQKKDLSNDLDGVNLNRNPWSFTDDAIVYLDHASGFLDKYKSKNELKNGYSKSNLEEFVSKYKNELEDDSWILAKYKLKNLN